MSSTTRKIAPSEWEHHKDTIVELYLTHKKPLKDVRAEMKDQHGFDASSWQYEMQLKRWSIRKNATRREWQRYFAANEDQPIANSCGDGPGTNIAPFILSKSTASKKRASRWVPGSIVAPKPVPTSHAVLAPRVSDSTSLDYEEHPNGVLRLDEPIVAQRNTQHRFQDAFQNMADSLHVTESFLLLNELCSINNFSTHNGLGSPSQTFADVPGTSAHSLGFSLTLSPMPGLQSPVYDLGTSDLADFPVMGLPAANNTAIFMLQDIRQILPFAQLEQSILSRGIMLEKSAGHTVFGGFASRVVAGILSSKIQSMARQASDVKHSLRMLGAQIPGESAALITDDQAFETKFARVLLFSMLNGFAGLDDIPIENVLRFLNRSLVDKLLLDVLEQSPRYVSRTLADNIFRAAIEASDTKVVSLLLNRRLVDVNETVCLHDTGKYTPIERASVLRSRNLMKSLINAGADVNKSQASFPGCEMGGALDALISNLQSSERELRKTAEWPKIQSESIEALKMLVAAGSQLHPRTMLDDKFYRSREFKFLVFQNARTENHRDYFQHEDSFIGIIGYLDDRPATSLIQNLISLCHKAGCNKCIVDFGDVLEKAVVCAASDGKLECAQMLLEADVRLDLARVFLGAIQSENPALIDFILNLGPNLDPPAIEIGATGSPKDHFSTPIAEAVRYGNEDLIELLEAGGCLDRLTEGRRFQAVVAAAAGAGNAAYMRKLLARAVTSKQAYRVTGEHLRVALDGGHQDIAQMLMEAGATSSHRSFPERKLLRETVKSKNMRMLHALISSLGQNPRLELNMSEDDHAGAFVVLNELLGSVDYHRLDDFLRKCIQTDTLDFFKEVLETFEPEYESSSLQSGSIDECLAVAVELDNSDMIEYLLDMGARPFHDSVLQNAISDRPDVLRLLLQKERRRQTMPKCIGVRALAPLMGNDAGNIEALDDLIRTGAINFARLEYLPFRDLILTDDEYRLTPLGVAIEGLPDEFDSNMVAMKKFLEADADPNGISKYNTRWTKGSPLMTALMVAIETGREDAVNMLLDYGADANARPRIRTTRTALQFAAELGNIDMVRLLLGRGADVNSSASPRGGATALQFAAMTGNCNMVAYLLDHGAQLDALPSKIDGMWPLEGAAFNGRLDMVRFLWELNVRAVAGGTFPDGFLERHCLRAMSFAREEEHIGCMYLISDLSGISVDRLETDEYGAPWIAY